MHGKITKEKEMLIELNKNLEEIKDFLIGSTPNEKCDQRNEECLQDIMLNNLCAIDNALALTNIIKETIKGGNK